MYHGFTDKENHEGIENYQGKHLNTELFRSQIRYLKHFYNVISLNQYIESFTKGDKLPKNSIVITIDDGYKSNYTFAFPILKEYDVPATIFLTTDFIDNKHFLWVDRLEYAINHTRSNDLILKIGGEKLSFRLITDKEKIFCDTSIRRKLKLKQIEIIEETIQQIEDKLNVNLSETQNVPKIYEPLGWNEIFEMIKSSKVNFGSHTHRHCIIARHNSEVIQNELTLSKKIIEKKTGKNTRLFCYPNGSIGCFNDKTKLMLNKLGYSSALTNVRGTNNEVTDLYELKRFGIGNTDLYFFILTISGVRYFLFKFKKLLFGGPAG